MSDNSIGVEKNFVSNQNDYQYKDNCVLVVTSCDKYETAWYPYFSLLQKYYPNHPVIVLNTETKKYRHTGIDIRCINSGTNISWSERLYYCLEQINTKYILFSLEDFFLQSHVNDSIIEKCYRWMEEDDNIAVFRLYPTSNPDIFKTDKYENFYIADSSIAFRLETQFAIWNRKTLMSFLDYSEDPWEFETYGTKRIANTDKIFLWLYKKNITGIDEDFTFPYLIGPQFGYGINWGKWLWNNKKLFEANQIRANFKQLGKISEYTVKMRYKYLWCQNPKGIKKMIKHIYTGIYIIRYCKNNGFIKTIKKAINKIKKIKRQPPII